MKHPAMCSLSRIAAAGAMALGLLAAPASAQSSGVFIEQIGTGGDIRVDQTANTQTARVTQDGAGNVALVDQQDGGEFTSDLKQDGDDNIAVLTQSGSGSGTIELEQTGDRNQAVLAQRDTGGFGSLAQVLQNGSDNQVNLTQDGSDNEAVLLQNGTGNAMTATQTGSDNSLLWTQDGTGLPDLGITQTGGAIAIISQSN